jgi:hypothetical protein
MEHRLDTHLWPPHLGGTERLREDLPSVQDLPTVQGLRSVQDLPSVQDCNHCANRCLEMWNESVDHAARSSLLRMADAWLQLAAELRRRPSTG